LFGPEGPFDKLRKGNTVEVFIQKKKAPWRYCGVSGPHIPARHRANAC